MTDLPQKILTRSGLIEKIDECHVITGLAHSTICQFAIGNSKTYQALVDGRPGPGIDGIEKLVAWIGEANSKALKASAQDDAA